ncbi:MAG: 2-C-methyl-D-erythritol 2,4-cyclodiphosphate synthase [Alcanivoracaceae bacterium]|nr:2-C-methyl-D-erythritol 2,4-cyclodiphosphate synthase [Alcanivoracaceae bacterium]
MRIGQGFDVHAFCEGDHVMLGGIRIAHDKGLKAHSDGDVALHALADALLGALALGDIGHFFPDTDPAWRGANSADLLLEVYRKVGELGFALGNADITIICQQPKIAPYVSAMRERIATLLQTSADCISVKATTTEKLGFTGRGEGIAVTAVVLLVSHD